MSIDNARLSHLREQLTALHRTIVELQRGLQTPLPGGMSQTVVKPRAGGYRLFGQEFPTRSANETLVDLFRHFAELDADFPERFRQEALTLGRSRGYVGRTPQEVYPGKEQLWEMTAQFAPGWHIGTHENNPTKLKLLRVACRVVGLRFGVDVIARM